VKSNTIEPSNSIHNLVKNIWNIISVDIGWGACVLGAAWGHHWLGMVVVFLLLIIHIAVIERNKIRIVFMVALITIVTGFLADTLLIILGTVEPNRWLMPPPFTAIWDLMIWVNFSITLDRALRFLQNKPILAAVLGAIIAPPTYYAAGRLGALQFSEPSYLGLIWVGVIWFFVMPWLALMAKRFYHSVKTGS
jgi:hypothetical protein